MNAFTVINRRPSFSTALAAGSVSPAQVLPPGSPLLSHTGVHPVGPEPILRKLNPGKAGVAKVNPVGPEPVLHFGLPSGSSFHITGPLEAMLPHQVE